MNEWKQLSGLQKRVSMVNPKELEAENLDAKSSGHREYINNLNLYNSHFTNPQVAAGNSIVEIASEQ